MSGLIMAAQLILGLSILVTLHELGHFLAARMFGIMLQECLVSRSKSSTCFLMHGE